MGNEYVKGRLRTWGSIIAEVKFSSPSLKSISLFLRKGQVKFIIIIIITLRNVLCIFCCSCAFVPLSSLWVIRGQKIKLVEKRTETVDFIGISSLVLWCININTNQI